MKYIYVVISIILLSSSACSNGLSDRYYEKHLKAPIEKHINFSDAYDELEAEVRIGDFESEADKEYRAQALVVLKEIYSTLDDSTIDDFMHYVREINKILSHKGINAYGEKTDESFAIISGYINEYGFRLNSAMQRLPVEVYKPEFITENPYYKFYICWSSDAYVAEISFNKVTKKYSYHVFLYGGD